MMKTIHCKSGFSLAELLLLVLFIGAFAAIAVPRMNIALVTEQNERGMVRTIVSALRRTRMMAIANAVDQPGGYGLKLVGHKDVTGYEIVTLGDSETVESLSFKSSLTSSGGNEFKFGPMGNLLSGSDNQVDITVDDKVFIVEITEATGMVKCSEE